MTKLVKVSRNGEAFWTKVIKEVKGDPNHWSPYIRKDKLLVEVDNHVKLQPFKAGDQIYITHDEILQTDTV